VVRITTSLMVAFQTLVFHAPVSNNHRGLSPG
jgi:hypothetical protein